MYKLKTKDGTYFFTCLADVFNFLDNFEEVLLLSEEDYVKLYFVEKKGRGEK